MTAPILMLHCGYDFRPADPLDALERLYTSQMVAHDTQEAVDAWAQAMITAEATLSARGRSVPAFEDGFGGSQ